MKPPVFGFKKLKKTLQKLGFVIEEDRGKGSHAIALHPKRKKSDPHARPFITIAKRKEYYPPSRIGYVKQLKEFGFSEEEILKHLR